MHEVGGQLTTTFKIFCVVLAFSISAASQGSARPFAAVDAALADKKADWSKASVPFQAERTRLGESFEEELWKFLGTDVNKYDYISIFLVFGDYLHGNPPMPYLALQIQNKALLLLRGKADWKSRGEAVAINVNAAGLSAELELREQAEDHKRNAERLVARDFLLVYSYPIRTEYENCVYELIGDEEVKGSSAAACLDKKRPEEKQEPAIIEMGEISKEKIILKPPPVFPATQPGSRPEPVRVRVMIDQTGNVESAQAVSGPSELQQAAVTAARMAHFQKTFYRGRAVKVSGVLVYEH
jgi:hypothetical protein